MASQKKAPRGKASRKKAARKKASPKRSPKGEAAAPKLLSSGNPQIPKGDGDGPVQAYIAAMPGWKHDVGRRLDALVGEVVPDARKAVRWNTPFYGVEGQGWFLAFYCYTRKVQVTFFRGASLEPVPPVGSKQPGVRYLGIAEGEALDEEQLRSWIRQASELPGDQVF